jgi:hypothetical protein
MIFDRNILCLIEKFKNPKQNKNIEIKNEDIKFLKEIFFILKL